MWKSDAMSRFVYLADKFRGGMRGTRMRGPVETRQTPSAGGKLAYDIIGGIHGHADQLEAIHV